MSHHAQIAATQMEASNAEPVVPVRNTIEAAVARDAGPRIKPGAHVQVESLSHRYRGMAADCLQAVDFTVPAGQVMALVGRSGCGKSTLLHLIAGLMQPVQGGVHIDGNRVNAASPRWVVMFQAPSLFPWMTVAQNAALGLRFARRVSEIPERVPALLEMVGLSAYADRNVQDLSGGQQQRVALARSLATQPDLLLLDEPFSALDAFTRRTLQQDVRRIAKDLGLTVILVTHDITEAAIMADRALIMAPDPGRIVTDTMLDPGPERHRDSPAFEAERARLAHLFETTA
jgi:NitT/TauT family transport system ATP-binding protein